jgi:hypothetical protein
MDTQRRRCGLLASSLSRPSVIERSARRVVCLTRPPSPWCSSSSRAHRNPSAVSAAKISCNMKFEDGIEASSPKHPPPKFDDSSKVGAALVCGGLRRDRQAAAAGGLRGIECAVGAQR